MILERAILEARKKSENKTRSCIYNKCNNNAIKSHVLQKNGILREISENNHLMELSAINPFDRSENGLLAFKRRGINDIYTFPGYCQMHDTNLFQQIELESDIDFKNKNQQALFCYRGLCQEIRRKEMALEVLNDTKIYFPSEMKNIVESLEEGYLDGIRNLSYFKLEFEKSITSNNYSQFQFNTIKVPRIDLCISVPLNIGELKMPIDLDYEKWKAAKIIPFQTSFINVFPKGNNTIIIIGQHTSYPCAWTTNWINKIQNTNKDGIFKELSDLVVLRVEFVAMSNSLFKNISNKELNKYKQIFRDNVYNYSPKLKTKLNLFKNI